MSIVATVKISQLQLLMRVPWKEMRYIEFLFYNCVLLLLKESCCYFHYLQFCLILAEFCEYSM